MSRNSLGNDGSVEAALTQAVDLVQTVKSRRKLGLSKTTDHYNAKLNDLQKKLKKSKVSVIQHLSNVQNIEKSIVQLNVSEDRLKNLIASGSTHKDKHHHEDIWLSKDDIELLEKTSSIPDFSGHSLQRSILLYDDSSLIHELNSFPVNQSAMIDKILFSKISWISSAKYISQSEAMLIFERATGLAYRYGDPNIPNTNYSGRRWEILKKMLRTKLKIRHAARSLEKIISSSNFLQRGNGVASSNDHFLANKDKSPRKKGITSTSSTLQHISLSSSSSMYGSHDANNKTNSASSIRSLGKQLNQSQSAQSLLEDKIRHNLSLVSQSLPIQSFNKAAFAFARKEGVKKVYDILLNKVKAYYRIGFSQFSDNCKMQKLEVTCAHFCKLHCSIRFYNILVRLTKNKKQRYFKDWIEHIASMKVVEFYSASVEIQRVTRGFMGRYYVKNIERINATRTMQRFVRGGFGRAKARVRRRELELKRCVRLIERCWDRCKWSRMTKKLRIQMRQERAAKSIQRVYRGHYKRLYVKYIRRKMNEIKGATKMQSVWRMYVAKVKVDLQFRNRKAWNAVTMMQCIVRGFYGRKRAKLRKLQLNSCCRIQRCIRCALAGREMRRRIRKKAAIQIQRIMRGFLARKRVKKLIQTRSLILSSLDNASAFICKIVLGYSVRRKWKDKIKLNTQSRLRAITRIKDLFKAVAVGNFVRRRVARVRHAGKIITKIVTRHYRLKKEKEELSYLQNLAAVILQRHARGRQGRKRFKKLYDRYILLQNMDPLYYRLKKMYIRDQNAFHGKQATLIQCLVRKKIARRVTNMARRNHRARKIQVVARFYIARVKAKEIVKLKKKEIYYLNRCAVQMQRVMRGFLGRVVGNIHRAGKIVHWFINEIKLSGLGRRAFIAMQARKRNIARANRAAGVVQALARGYLGRNKVRLMLPKLIKRREKRIQLKKVRSATKIQSVIRMIAAKKIFLVKRAEFIEREKRRKKLEEFENNIDSIHDNHMKDLLAIRVQGGVRELLAKKYVAQKKIDVEYEAAQKLLQHKAKMASVIQALARGVIGRRKFKEMKPELKKRVAARNFCVECEIEVATKKCRVCKEQYCDACFTAIHRKGRRQGHIFEIIRSNKVTSKSDNPLLWTEYYDHNAQGKYWYHSLTGEATWICPY